MNVAVLIVSRNRPDLVGAQAESLARNSSLPHDVYVVEAGTDDDKLCEHSTVRYADEEFRGKAFAHNVALEEARRAAHASGKTYDYYWVLMNDVVFDEGVDAMKILVETMEREPSLGILSPTAKDGLFPGSARQPGGGWRPVATCDSLGFMIRGTVVETVGFLNPDFRYGLGAIHELSFLVHSNGKCVGYSDDVTYTHLGGTTYGAEGTRTIPREEYQRRAKRFAFAYFNRVYGPGWARVFWERAKPFGATFDTYTEHEESWMDAFTPEEIQEIRGEAAAALAARVVGNAPARAPRATGDLLRLHLGCGPDKRDGWVNVDVNEHVGPDLVSRAESLPTLEDSSCAVIEACHLFEHLTLAQAKAALTEWRRLLAPGGELHLELPNLARCVELIGTDMNGMDLGMISLFGNPQEVDERGEPQLHKWGWTPATLGAAMLAAGFDDVEEAPVTQARRTGAEFDRDMRLVARVAVPVEVPTEPVIAPASPATESMTRVLAWPRYDDQAELDRFFNVFARVLEGRADVALFLRIDPELDPTRDTVIRALDATHARVLGPEAALNIKLLEGPITPQEWRDIGPMLACRIQSESEAAPRDTAKQVPAPVAGDAAALLALVTGSPCGTGASEQPIAGSENGVIIPVGVAADSALVKRIAELQPWLYPVTIDGMTVVPGLGSGREPEWLASRAAHRAQLLVADVLGSVNMHGKTVLDLACNCGFWSSYYAEAGAAKVVGLEGRQRHVEQAELYWERGRFLPKDSYTFIHGNVSDRSDWAPVLERGPYDVTLCAGILSHVANYAEILAWAAEITNEVLIIDTRVQHGAEERITGPGDPAFAGIDRSRDGIVPDREGLLATLRQVGFDPQVLEAPFGSELGVDDLDSYADGSRVTIVARKVQAAVA